MKAVSLPPQVCSTPDAKIVSINGRFLSQRFSGVQRFATEIVKAIDQELQNHAAETKWQIIVPSGADISKLKLKSILVKYAPGSGHIWDQISLPIAARGSVLLSLCNTGPVIYSPQILVMHDAAVYRFPVDFSLVYRIAHLLLGCALSKTAQIATVSAFSRHEISQTFNIDEEKIILVPNGAGHIQNSQMIPPERHTPPKPYFLMIGNPSPRKNHEVVYRALATVRHSIDASIVVVGKIRADWIKKYRIPPNSIISAPAQSDQELGYLYTNAVALIFPSIYEGFGIPPLEALAYGCPVIATDIPPVVEVCGDAASYFSPQDADALAKLMTASAAHRGNHPSPGAAFRVQLLARFNWTTSALALIEASQNARLRGS